MRTGKILAASLLLLAACTQDIIHIDRITLDPPSVIMAVEDTQQLTVHFLSGSQADLQWYSSDEGIAKVSQSGLVTAVAPGTATIFAGNADNGQFASCEVFIRGYREELVAGVQLSEHDITLYLGENVQFTATVLPTTALNQDVSWSSSSTGVAWIDQEGYMITLLPGTTVITVKTDEGGFTDSCNVTVLPEYKYVESVWIPEVLHLGVGESQQIDVVIEPEDANNPAVSWRSLNESIVTVTQEGLVTGISPGTAHIKVTAEDGQDGSISQYCLVTVTGEDSGGSDESEQ